MADESIWTPQDAIKISEYAAADLLNIKIAKQEAFLYCISAQPGTQKGIRNKMTYINNLIRLYNSEKFFWMEKMKEKG